MPADVATADTAYDADHFRLAIARKGALAVIPNNPSRSSKHPLDADLYASDISSNAASAGSSSSDASLRGSRKPRQTYLAVIIIAAAVLSMR